LGEKNKEGFSPEGAPPSPGDVYISKKGEKTLGGRPGKRFKKPLLFSGVKNIGKLHRFKVRENIRKI